MARMRFYGRFQGEPLTVDWEDGVLVAPFIFKSAVAAFMVEEPDIALTPEGPAIPTGISDHLEAYYTISQVFDKLPTVRGDIPEWNL